jgi:hypothetical protein
VFAAGSGSITAASGWTPIAAMAFTSPTLTAGGTSRALDGNNATNRAVLSGTVGDLTWGAGQELWIRWNDAIGATKRAIMGLDDLVFTATTNATTPGPVLSSVSPATVGQGSTQMLTLTGSNFQSGVTITLAPANAALSLGNVQHVDATTLTVTLTVAANAVPGTQGLTVINPDLQAASVPALLTIRGALVNWPASGFVYEQNFDTLAASGTGLAWVNGATLPGWFAAAESGAARTAYSATDGGSPQAGLLLSLGKAGTNAVTDRALGSQNFNAPSNAVTSFIGVGFRNTSGRTLQSGSLDYTGELWRVPGSAQTGDQLVFQFQVFDGGAGSLTAAGGWIEVPALNFISPVPISSVGQGFDGNNPADPAGNHAGLGASIGLNWAPDQELWLRWGDGNEATDGHKHAVGIDDFAFTASTNASPPLIVSQPGSQPGSQTNQLGGNTTFSVSLLGTPPFDCQWFKNGTPLSAPHDPVLSLTGLQMADEGGYQVVVTNATGATTSLVATLTVNRPPQAANTNVATLQNNLLEMFTGRLLGATGDPDGDATIIIAAGPASTNGGTVMHSPPTISFRPAQDFVGVDQFTYTVSDGRGGTAVGTVTVMVVASNTPSLSLVNPPGRLPNGLFHAGFAGVPSLDYAVEQATNLAGPWSFLTSLPAAENGSLNLEEVIEPALAARFYRTRHASAPLAALHPTNVPNLVAFWDFQEPAGQDRVDVSASRFHLLESNGPVARVQLAGAPFGPYAAQFNGAQHLRIPRAQVGDLDIHGSNSQVTVVAWLQRQSTSLNAIAGIWDEYRAQRQYCLFLGITFNTQITGNVSHRVSGHVSQRGGPTPGYSYCYEVSLGDTVVPQNQWMCVALSYDGRFIRSFYNGRFDGANPSPNPPYNMGNPYHLPLGIHDGGNSGGDFTVGGVPRSGTGNNFGNYFNGVLGGVAVFNRALNEEEMLRLARLITW